MQKKWALGQGINQRKLWDNEKDSANSPKNEDALEGLNFLRSKQKVSLKCQGVGRAI
jgi:hypothetical protein